MIFSIGKASSNLYVVYRDSFQTKDISLLYIDAYRELLFELWTAQLVNKIVEFWTAQLDKRQQTLIDGNMQFYMDSQNITY